MGIKHLCDFLHYPKIYQPPDEILLRKRVELAGHN